MELVEQANGLFVAHRAEIVAFLGVLGHFDVEMIRRSLLPDGPLAQTIGRTFDEMQVLGVAHTIHSLLLGEGLTRWDSEGSLQGYTLTSGAKHVREQAIIQQTERVDVKDWALRQYEDLSRTNSDHAVVYAARLAVLET